MSLFTVLTCRETVTQSQSLNTELLTESAFHNLVSVKLCKCVVCCVDFDSVADRWFSLGFSCLSCYRFFGEHSNYSLVGRPHFSKTSLKTKKQKQKHHSLASLLKDQCYEKLKNFLSSLINIFLKKQMKSIIVWETQKWNENFSWPSHSWVIDQNWQNSVKISRTAWPITCHIATYEFLRQFAPR